MLLGRPLIIVDLETTGLDTSKDEVIQIGAVRVDQETLDIEATFEAKVLPLYAHLADPESLRINGYTSQAWSDAVSQSDGWQSFWAFSRQSIFCSFSTRFDWGFTYRYLVEHPPSYGIRPDRNSYGPFNRHLVDIPSIAWGLLGPIPKLSKDWIAEYLGLRKEPSVHSGLQGALHARRVLKELRIIARTGWQNKYVEKAA